MAEPMQEATYEHEPCFRWVVLAEELYEALRFHEDRRINPTTRGGPALARFERLRDEVLHANPGLDTPVPERSDGGDDRGDHG